MTLTTDQWLAELEKVTQDDPGNGMTSAEIAAANGWGVWKVHAQIKRAVADGKLVVRWANRPNVLGRMVKKPVYVPVKPKKARR